jgi:hypothetical protein
MTVYGTVDEVLVAGASGVENPFAAAARPCDESGIWRPLATHRSAGRAVPHAIRREVSRWAGPAALRCALELAPFSPPHFSGRIRPTGGARTEAGGA